MNIIMTKANPIIMVDDSAADRLIAKRCYDKSVLQNPFMTFSEGHEFLTHMDSVLIHEAPMPALVLLDLNMPKLDGFEVLGFIRQHPEFTHAPLIVMLTNTDNPKDLKRSMDMGANRFQTKPFHVADYVAFFDSFGE